MSWDFLKICFNQCLKNIGQGSFLLEEKTTYRLSFFLCFYDILIVGLRYLDLPRGQNVFCCFVILLN